MDSYYGRKSEPILVKHMCQFFQIPSTWDQAELKQYHAPFLQERMLVHPKGILLVWFLHRSEIYEEKSLGIVNQNLGTSLTSAASH